MSDELMALAFRAHAAWKEYARTYELASRKSHRASAFREAVTAEDLLAAEDRKASAAKQRRRRKAVPVR